jgi:hypothetical protein
VRNFNYPAIGHHCRRSWVVPDRLLARARLFCKRRTLFAPMVPSIARMLKPCRSLVGHAPYVRQARAGGTCRESVGALRRWLLLAQVPRLARWWKFLTIETVVCVGIRKDGRSWARARRAGVERHAFSSLRRGDTARSVAAGQPANVRCHPLEPLRRRAAVRNQLRAIWGSPVDSWVHLRTDAIAHDQPEQRPPFPPKQPVALGQGLSVCCALLGSTLRPIGPVQPHSRSTGLLAS